MDRTERFHLIHNLLNQQRFIPIERFLQRLEVSRATFKRDLEYMRERHNAPIIWDRDQRGYTWDKTPQTGPRYELPGLWFSPQEILALLTMQRLLSDLEPGLLTPHIQPLISRLELMLGTGDHSSREIHRRIRILQMARRKVNLPHFGTLATATLKRLRLEVRHWNRERNEETTRTLSPQRLVHYRDNWYLDAWCHQRKALRTFSVDAIRAASLLETKAKDVAEREMDDTFADSYGIFSGKAKHSVILRFTSQRARWVAAESWHPKQKSRFDEQGRYILELPYSDDRELMMDILKYGPDVEVLAPESLREQIHRLIGQSAKFYEQ